MGGRGASSGVSNHGNEYGSQYETLLTSGNMRFVRKTSPQSETLMETATKGRVYIVVDSKDHLGSVVYFDQEMKRSKQIDLSHRHKGKRPHAHEGYLHDGDARNLTEKELAMVERVYKVWNNRKRK